MKKEKITIYLGDLVHNFIPARDIWTIPLNICNIASYVNSYYRDKVEFRLFKFSGALLKAINDSPPDIIGLSNYIWNAELSQAIVRLARKKKRETVTIMGGPNVTQTKERMTQFMNGCSLDFFVSLYGEHPFKCIVSAMLKPGFKHETLHMDPGIHGVWYLDPISKKAVEIPVKYTITDLDEIPSPFKNGFVDEFLKQGLIPMIETNRGCPFECTYCDWGIAGLRKISKYSINRIKEDIDYCRRHSKDERLMIDDANFGILGERDLVIAKYIQRLRKQAGYPDKLIVTWSQAKSEAGLKIADALKDMLMITTSFQSMNKVALRNIKRENITHKDFMRIIKFSKKRKIDTYGELMLALPGETLNSHLQAIRYLFDAGVDFININPLILLEGSLLARKEEREKYGLKTKWRLLENCYGIYNKSPVIEFQEMVIQTNTLSEKDYLLCRTLSWLIQMSWNLRRHDILLRYAQSLGCNPLDIILKAIKDYKKASMKVVAIFEDFLQDAQNELFKTKEGLISYYSQPEQIEVLKEGGFRKLNTHYPSRVSLECDKEFADYYKEITKESIKEKLRNSEKEDNRIEDCSKFMYHRYIGFHDLVRLTKGENINKKLSFRYHILEWNGQNKKPLQDFHIPDRVNYAFFIDPKQKKTLLEHLKRFAGLSHEYQLRKLQEPYHGIHKKHLLYRIRRQGKVLNG